MTLSLFSSTDDECLSCNVVHLPSAMQRSAMSSSLHISSLCYTCSTDLVMPHRLQAATTGLYPNLNTRNK